MAIGVTPYRRFNAVINSSGITGASNLTGTSTFDVDIEDEGGFVRLDQVLLLDSDIPHSHYELVGVECQFNQTSTNPNPLSSIRIQIFSNSPSVVFHFDQILFINQINDGLVTFGGSNNIITPIINDSTPALTAQHLNLELSITDDTPDITWTIKGNNTDPSPAMRVYYRYHSKAHINNRSKIHINNSSKLSIT